MGSPPVLDLDVLLQPIPGEVPTGGDLREDPSPTPIYYQIKDARNAARAAERQGEFEPVIGSVEIGAWRPVAGPAIEVLTGRSKDLELVAWLIEALARTEGFAGLRDGFRLARGLVEQFWDGLYPMPDEDGIETRVSPLTGLNGAGAAGTLLAPISRIPISAAASVDAIAVWSCQQALDLERASPDDQERRIAEGATTMEVVRTAVRETPVDLFVQQLEDIEAALDELRQLGAKLDERCGHDAPPTSAIREALENAADTIRRIARDVLPAETDAPAGDTAAAADAGVAVGAASSPAAGGVAVGGVPGSIQDREDALRALTKVADYFRRAEPHSPLAFLVERTVRWGRLELPDLLAELIPDEAARDTYAQLTGVKINMPDEE